MDHSIVDTSSRTPLPAVAARETDSAYLARRNQVAGLAAAHRPGEPAQRVEYLEEEHELWQKVARRIDPLRKEKVCAPVRAMLNSFEMDFDRLPQLADISARVYASTGFRLEPVGGLIAPRAFLEALADGVFCATQFVRDPSSPFAASEPDVVHELLGHAATLADPTIASLNCAFGRAAQKADDQQIDRIAHAYWFTLEHGIVLENGDPKAFGAALLSSCDELENFDLDADIRPWNLFAVATAEYDPPARQRRRFIAPSYARLLADTETWLERGGWSYR